MKMPVPHWRIRYFWHRWSHTVAYLFVVVMSAVALTIGLDNANDDREALAESARKVVRANCEADLKTALALRSALEGNIRFVKKANEPPPPTVGERVAQLERIIATIPIPDCDKRVEIISDGRAAEDEK